MSRLGRVNFRDGSGPAFLGGSGFGDGDHYSQQTAHEIDLEVRRILDEATREVRAILQARRPALEALALRLIDKEVIEGDELRQLIEEFHPGPKLVHASAAISAPTAADEPPARSDGKAVKGEG